MKYDQFLKSERLDKAQLIAWGKQTLIDDAPDTIPSLPSPPMLMFDRITSIKHNGKRGRIVAEQDIALDAWYFMCHFGDDPVQPGCLGVDAIWQLLGMYCALRGATGSGRALGCKEVDFSGQIRPHDSIVTYTVDVRRYALIQGAAVVINPLIMDQVGLGEKFVFGECLLLQGIVIFGDSKCRVATRVADNLLREPCRLADRTRCAERVEVDWAHVDLALGEHVLHEQPHHTAH